MIDVVRVAEIASSRSSCCLLLWNRRLNPTSRIQKNSEDQKTTRRPGQRSCFYSTPLGCTLEAAVLQQVLRRRSADQTGRRNHDRWAAGRGGAGRPAAVGVAPWSAKVRTVRRRRRHLAQRCQWRWGNLITVIEVHERVTWTGAQMTQRIAAGRVVRRWSRRGASRAQARWAASDEEYWASHGGFWETQSE